MKLFKQAIVFVVLLGVAATACNRNDKAEGEKSNLKTVKGLYSFGPEVKSFTLCEDGREYWVKDSVKNLELSYSNLGFEKPYEPVYVELEGYFAKSDTGIVSSDFDSTLVVMKVLKISKEIPDGPCAQ
jgi:copper homeostasis protein (lipoprotein)